MITGECTICRHSLAAHYDCVEKETGRPAPPFPVPCIRCGCDLEIRLATAVPGPSEGFPAMECIGRLTPEAEKILSQNGIVFVEWRETLWVDQKDHKRAILLVGHLPNVDGLQKEEKNMLQCGKCGNRFDEIGTFRSHACMGKRLIIAVMVSPRRKDTDLMRKAAVSLAEKAVYHLRGIACEEPFSEAARKAGADVILCPNGTIGRLRDEKMLERADLVLAFPSVQDSPKDEISKKQLDVDGRKVPVIVYADKR